jgi:hypothetical protein
MDVGRRKQGEQLALPASECRAETSEERTGTTEGPGAPPVYVSHWLRVNQVKSLFNNWLSASFPARLAAAVVSK